MPAGELREVIPGVEIEAANDIIETVEQIAGEAEFLAPLAVFTMAIGYWGDIQIELIKTDSDAPSLYAGEYAVRDRLHHVCVFVDDIAETRRACAEAGAEVIVEGKVGEDGEVIYVDRARGRAMSSNISSR